AALDRDRRGESDPRQPQHNGFARGRARRERSRRDDPLRGPLRLAASAVACLVAAFAVMSAIVVAGSVMRDVAIARPSAIASSANAGAAARFPADVVLRLDALVAKFPGN